MNIYAPTMTQFKIWVEGIKTSSRHGLFTEISLQKFFLIFLQWSPYKAPFLGSLCHKLRDLEQSTSTQDTEKRFGSNASLIRRACTSKEEKSPRERSPQHEVERRSVTLTLTNSGDLLGALFPLVALSCFRLCLGLSLFNTSAGRMSSSFWNTVWFVGAISVAFSSFSHCS